MPNRWTFTIKPIRELLQQEVDTSQLWIDPFCGMHSPARVKNDLNPDIEADYHMDALDFLKSFCDASIDGVLFDPPYSPRQVSECYKGVGMEVTQETTQMTFWSRAKDEIARILKPGGKALCFGWNSMGLGIGRGCAMTRLLIVPHGGSKNDTICTVEVKA
jgi:hypothetical protein